MCRFIRRQTLTRRTFCRQTPAGRSIPCILHLHSSAVGRRASHWLGQEEGAFRRSFPPILALRGCFNACSIVFNTPGAAVVQSISAARDASLSAAADAERASGALWLSGAEMWSPAQVSDRASTSYTTNITLSLVCIATFSCVPASPAGKLRAPSRGMLWSRTSLAPSS